MTQHSQLSVRVRDIEPISATLKRFTFDAADGGELPTGLAGGHIVLTLRGAERTWRNSYSLVTPPDHRETYQIIVRRCADGRGGSVYLHDHVKTGDVLPIQWPSNMFPIMHAGHRHVLFGGGIGITPFLSYIPVLRAAGTPFELHQICRPDEVATFARLVAPLGVDAASIHAVDVGETFDFAAILQRQPLGTHVYTCGPKGMMDAVTGAASELGWPSSSVHTESFGADRTGAPITVIAQRSGKTVEVRADMTILEALEEAGLEPPCLCRGGACGMCLTKVVSGTPDHRDDFLDDAARQGNGEMMICVSRAKTRDLVLDI